MSWLTNLLTKIKRELDEKADAKEVGDRLSQLSGPNVH